jgi:hypothetical protein
VILSGLRGKKIPFCFKWIRRETEDRREKREKMLDTGYLMLDT